MRFFVGIYNVYQGHHFEAAFISVNRLWKRKSDFPVNDWILDSGAFTEISRHGDYQHSVMEYAAQIRRWRCCGRLLAAVSQDWMCEPFITARTGLNVADHQRLTIERYDALLAEDTGGVPIMPVLQGYNSADYVSHIQQYGDRLNPGMWVGVGSICKRNGDPRAIIAILTAIKRSRPDLRLHGFGLKTTALASALIQDRLYSADSMAWSFAAYRGGRDAHNWREASAFAERIRATRNPAQLPLWG